MYFQAEDTGIMKVQKILTKKNRKLLRLSENWEGDRASIYVMPGLKTRCLSLPRYCAKG